MKTRTKAAIAVAVTGIVLAGGGIAVAEAATPTTVTGHGHRGSGLKLKRIEQGQFVTKDGKTGAQVTHEIANGDVTAVSPTSITVKTGDGKTVTFTVSSSTKVHVKGQAKGSTGSISSVKTGQQALVVGTGTGPFAATRIGVR